LGGFAVAPPQSRLVMLVCALFASTAAPQRCCVRTHRHILRLTATLNCLRTEDSWHHGVLRLVPQSDDSTIEYMGVIDDRYRSPGH
jgi:hypothetical protein